MNINEILDLIKPKIEWITGSWKLAAQQNIVSYYRLPIFQMYS